MSPHRNGEKGYWCKGGQEYEKGFIHTPMIFFYNDFVHHVLKIIWIVNERIPRSIRKFVKPKMWFDFGKQLTHDWGSAYFFEEYIVIRIYGYP